jgi:hypothetical protein
MHGFAKARNRGIAMHSTRSRKRRLLKYNSSH